MTTPANSSAKNRSSNKKPELVVANWETLNTLPDGKGGRLRITSAQASATATTYSSATGIDGRAYGAPQKTTNGGGGGKKKKIADPKPPAPNYFYDENYKWNLPPHAWSMPVEPASINPTTSKYAGEADTFHALRRGRIFYCAGLAGSSVKASSTEEGKLESASKTGKPNKYGFHFLWNPEKFNQSTGVNMKLTYDASDPTTALYALAPANATVSFVIRLDRTNDFACFNDLKHRNDQDRIEYNNEASRRFAEADESGLPIRKKTVNIPFGGQEIDQTFAAKYYEKGKPLKSDKDFQDNMQEKLNDLMKYGTMADLEYLYRAINGDGFSFLGRETSNLGYLFPTLVRLDLGPQKWVGVIRDIGVEHIGFTQDMIPIRTDVTISLDVRASTANLVSSKDMAYNQDPATTANNTTTNKG